MDSNYSYSSTITTSVHSMTDDEAEQIYDMMSRVFGTSLPHPEREPIRFRFYCKLYKYLVDKQYK